MLESDRNVPENMCPKSLRPSFPYLQKGDGLLKYEVKQRCPHLHTMNVVFWIEYDSDMP